MFPEGSLQYDALFKTVLLSPESRLLRRIAGAHAVEQLNIEFSSVDRRVPDLVCRLSDGRILHLELQTANDPQMAWRMLEYYVRITRRFPDAEVVQSLLYIGNGVLTMPDHLTFPTLHYRYGQLDIRTFDPEEFLNSPIETERTMALLCDPVQPLEIIDLILANWLKLPRKEFRRLLEKLVLASRLRGFDKLVEGEVDRMAIDWDEVIRDNKTIQGWVEKYSSHAIEETRQQTTQQVKRTDAISYLRDVIELRFGDSPQWANEKIEAASVDQLKAWFKRATVVTDFNDIFA